MRFSWARWAPVRVPCLCCVQATTESEACEEALTAKREGNELYKAGNYKSAVASYTEAIEFEPQVHTFYGNRAAANMMLEKFEAAEADCVKACELNKDYIKGYLRLAKARLSQVRHMGLRVLASLGSVGACVLCVGCRAVPCRWSFGTRAAAHSRAARDSVNEAAMRSPRAYSACDYRYACASPGQVCGGGRCRHAGAAAVPSPRRGAG